MKKATTMSDQGSDADRLLFPITTVGISFLVLAVSFACRAVLGLGMQEWNVAFGWTRGEMSSAGSVALVTMAATVSLAGYSADRWGSRFVLAFGCAVLALGLAVMSAMTVYWQLILGYGLLCGMGFGLVSLPVVGSLVGRRTKTRQGLATGVATSGASGGQFLFLPILAALFSFIGWRGSIAAFAVLAAVASIVALFGLVATPVSMPIAEPDVMARISFFTRIIPVMRSRAFQGLFWSFTICGFTTTGIVETHFIPFAQMCGFSTGASTGAYGLFAFFNLVGMVGAGFLADRMDRRKLLIGIYALRSLALLVPLFVGANYPLLLVFSILIGIAFYAVFPGIIGLSAAHFGSGNVGLVVGLLTVGHALGAAGGAAFGGYAFDFFLRYDVMWMAAVLLALMSALFAALVPDPRSRSTGGWNAATNRFTAQPASSR